MKIALSPVLAGLLALSFVLPAAPARAQDTRPVDAIVAVVDEDVNIYDPQDVEWALATRFRPDRDILLIPDARGHELNPITDGGLGCKIGLDATAPCPRPWAFQRVRLQPVDLGDYEIEA